MELLENAMGRVDVLERDGCILLSPIGDANGMELRQLFVAGLDYMRKQSVSSLISNFSSVAPFTADDAHWIRWTWIPQMKVCGCRRWAVVRPTHTVAAGGLPRLTKVAIETGIQVEVFEFISEARTWLGEKSAQDETF